jgi:hypothetical protein
MNGASLTTPSLPGGSLPDIPASSLLNTPAAGNVSNQIAQGQSLLNQVQAAAGGDSGAQQALLKAATTTLQSATSGLPRALITDVAGVAAGFAMGGPVGGAVAAAGVAVSLFSSIFSSGAPPVYEGIESKPSQAASENWRKLQFYISQPNIIGSTQSNLPPGWYASEYLTLTAPPRTTSSPSEMLAQVKGTYVGAGADPYAAQLMSQYGANDIVLENVSSACPPVDLPKALLTMSLADFLGAPGERAGAGSADGAWLFMWPDPSGANLTGGLEQGFSFVPPGIDPLPGSPFCNLMNMQLRPGPGLTTLQPSSKSATWTAVLNDIIPHPRLAKATIATNALKLMPDPMWWQSLLYAHTFMVDLSGDWGNYLFNCDLMNAMATVLVMAWSGAHPRAITSDLLMQAAVIRNYGGAGAGTGKLTAAHQEFLDQWLNIAVGKRPGAHHPATKPAKNKTVRKTAAAPLRSSTKAPKLLAPVSAPAGSSPFLQPAFLYPAAGVGGALALYAGYRYLRR